jgi:hypothetical protein
VAEIEKRSRTMFPDLFDWLEDFPRPMRRPFTEVQPIRVEDYEEGGRYVMRAELPGIDPDKDVEITVEDGMLTVRGERREETKEKHRSEFLRRVQPHCPAAQGRRPRRRQSHLQQRCLDRQRRPTGTEGRGQAHRRHQGVTLCANYRCRCLAGRDHPQTLSTPGQMLRQPQPPTYTGGCSEHAPVVVGGVLCTLAEVSQ